MHDAHFACENRQLDAADLRGCTVTVAGHGERHVERGVRDLSDGPVLFTRGRAVALRNPEFGNALEGLAAGDDVRSPMPGKILDVKAKAGQDVKKGDVLFRIK